MITTGNLDSTANVSVIPPEVIANEIQGYLSASLNLGKTVDNDQALGAVQVGKVLSIPRRGTVVAQQKTENSTVATQKVTASDVTINVNQHWYVRILEEDFTRSVQPGSLLPGYAIDAAAVLAEQVESTLAGYIPTFDNIDFDHSDTNDSAVKAVGRVRTRMVKNKIPQFLTKFGYISPELNQWLADSGAYLTPQLESLKGALLDGSVGQVRGFNLFESQLAPGEGSPAWQDNFFYTSHALVLASRPLQVPGSEFGVQATAVTSDAGVVLRYVRAWSDLEMGVVIQLDTVFGAGVNDSRQGFVLQSH